MSTMKENLAAEIEQMNLVKNQTNPRRERPTLRQRVSAEAGNGVFIVPPRFR